MSTNQIHFIAVIAISAFINQTALSQTNFEFKIDSYHQKYSYSSGGEFITKSIAGDTLYIDLEDGMLLWSYTSSPSDDKFRLQETENSYIIGNRGSEIIAFYSVHEKMLLMYERLSLGYGVCGYGEDENKTAKKVKAIYSDLESGKSVDEITKSLIVYSNNK